MEELSKRLGVGNSIRFWKDTWLGGDPLEVVFQRLFVVSEMKNDFISAFGCWENGVWVWDFKWRRQFFAWEEDLLLEFENLIKPIVLHQREDTWTWKPHASGLFNTNSAYEVLLNNENHGVMLADVEVKAFRLLWKSKAPLKVVAFSWQLLLDRLPTKINT